MTNFKSNELNYVQAMDYILEMVKMAAHLIAIA